MLLEVFKMAEILKADLLDLFFPGIGGHVKSPDSPNQYSQRLYFSGSDDIETIHRQLIGICMWARENFKDGTWYINRKEFDLPNVKPDVCFCFDFANAEDMMAFKLRWG